MKLLLFSDVHSDLRQCRRLVGQVDQEAVDLVIGAGDFGNLRRGLHRTIDALKDIDRPAVLGPGNSESETELSAACQGWPTALVLHGSGGRVNGLAFWGIGGGIPVTPFGAWSFDFTEEQATAMLVGCPQGAILVTHSPPHGAVSSRGSHLGSRAIRQAIIMKKPKLVVPYSS